MQDTLKHLKRQGFTRVLRYHLNLLQRRTITHAEYVVLAFLADKTLSWSRLWEQLSLSDFQRGCALSRQGVVDALDQLQSLQLIVRKPVGRSYAYAIVPEGLDPQLMLVDKAKVVVNSVDQHQSTQLTDRGRSSSYVVKKKEKKGEGLVDNQLGRRAAPTCEKCRGTGWATAPDGSGVYRCPCVMEHSS